MRRPSPNMFVLSMLADMAIGAAAASFVFGHATVGFAAMAAAFALELVRALDREGRMRVHRRSALEKVLQKEAERGHRERGRW